MRRRLSFRALQEDESGQALVYVALILAILVAVLFAIFDLGRLTCAKIKAQNAADAAALAAVSVKVSVHHTRELAYLAMTDQALHARIELLQAITNFPSPTSFQDHIDKANHYIRRIKDLRQELMLYNQWVDQEGPAIVADAARLAYAANIQGINGALTTGRGVDEANLKALDAPGALRENSHENLFIGDVNYPDEGLGPHKIGGKSFVEVDPQYVGFDWSILGFGIGKPIDLPVWAAAGVASSDAIVRDPAAKGQDLKVNLPIVGQIGLNWYSPRLMRTGQKQDGSFGGTANGGGVESDH